MKKVARNSKPKCSSKTEMLIIVFNLQAIKQKLQINRNRTLTSIGERASPQEEDKAKMLFGNRHAVRKY